MLSLAFTLSSTDAMLPLERINKTRSGAKKIHKKTHSGAMATSTQPSKKTPKSTRPAQPAAEDRHDVDISDLASAPTDSFASLPADTLTQPQQDYSQFAWASDLWNAGKLSEEQKLELERQGLNLSRVLVLRGTEIKNLGDMPFWKYADCVVIGDEVEKIFHESMSYHDYNMTYLSFRVCCGPNSKLCHIGYIDEDRLSPCFYGQFDIPPSITQVSAAMFLSVKQRGMIFFHPKCSNIEFIKSWQQDFNVILNLGHPRLTCLNNNTLENLYKSVPETKEYLFARSYDECCAVIAADMARACMNIDYSQHVEKYRTWGSAAVLKQKGILPPTIEKVLADNKLELSDTYVMRGKSLFKGDISCEILKYPIIYIDSDVEWMEDECFEGLDNLRTIIFGLNSPLNLSIEDFPKCKKLEKVIRIHSGWGPAAVLQRGKKLPETVEKVLVDHKLKLDDTYVMRGKNILKCDISDEILKYPIIYIDSDVEWMEDECFEGLDNLRTIIFGPNSPLGYSTLEDFPECKKLEKVIRTHSGWGAAAVLQRGKKLPETVEKVLVDHKLKLDDTYVMRGKSLFRDNTSCEIRKYPVVYIDSDVEYIGRECFEGLSNLHTIIFGANSQVESIEDAAFSGCKTLEKVIFVSYPEKNFSWLREACKNAGIERDKLQIEPCDTTGKAYLLRDLYAAIWCKKHPNFGISTESRSCSALDDKDIAEHSQLPNKQKENIEKFLKMDPEQKASIADFIQQTDNDEIEQLCQYYGVDYEFCHESSDVVKKNVYVVSGEHIRSVSPRLNTSKQKLIFAPNVKSISVSFCSKATSISFMKGSQFTGFVDPSGSIKINDKSVDSFYFPNLEMLSLENCNIKVLPTGFCQAPLLRRLFIPYTVEEIEAGCFGRACIRLVVFELGSRLVKMQDVCLSECLVCIGPSRFFPKGWFQLEAMFTPYQRVLLLLRDNFHLSFKHLSFKEVCAWSPEYAVQAMKANMLPQEEAQTKK